MLQHIILVLFLITTFLLRKGPNQQYYWFLFNGLWIHIYLDGVVGFWQGHDW